MASAEETDRPKSPETSEAAATAQTSKGPPPPTTSKAARPSGLHVLLAGLGPTTPTARLLAFLIARAPAWIEAERSAHRPTGRALAAHEIDALKSFMPLSVLAEVRLASVPVIQNPPFYADLERAGIEIPLDFRQMTGITFMDTILVAEAAPIPSSEWLPLLFHELVHVLQYQELGLDRFVQLYVLGWAAGGFRYEDIPLERDAYELDGQFRAAPTESFDGLRAVRGRLSAYTTS